MQRHQRGSIIGFVVVGALLAIAVVGGIYLVKNQLNGNMPSFLGGDDASQVANEQEEPADQPQEGNQAQPDEATNDRPEPETTPPTESDDESAAPTERDDSAAGDREDMPQTGVDTPAQTADELPQTGAADNLYVLVALGALTGSVVAFHRSGRL